MKKETIQKVINFVITVLTAVLSSVTIYISIHPLNRLYLKAIQEMLKIKNNWI